MLPQNFVQHGRDARNGVSAESAVVGLHAVADSRKHYVIALEVR